MGRRLGLVLLGDGVGISPQASGTSEPAASQAVAATRWPRTSVARSAGSPKHILWVIRAVAPWNTLPPRYPAIAARIDTCLCGPAGTRNRSASDDRARCDTAMCINARSRGPECRLVRLVNACLTSKYGGLSAGWWDHNWPPEGCISPSIARRAVLPHKRENGRAPCQLLCARAILITQRIIREASPLCELARQIAIAPHKQMDPVNH